MHIRLCTTTETAFYAQPVRISFKSSGCYTSRSWPLSLIILSVKSSGCYTSRSWPLPLIIHSVESSGPSLFHYTGAVACNDLLGDIKSSQSETFLFY